MHDGCARTLMDRFVAACGGGDRHGVTSKLRLDEMADLVGLHGDLVARALGAGGFRYTIQGQAPSSPSNPFSSLTVSRGRSCPSISLSARNRRSRSTRAMFR